MFPEAWDRLAGHAERAGIGYQRGRSRLIEAYAGLLRHRYPEIRDAASQAWSGWEDTHVSLAVGKVRRDPRCDDRRTRLGLATLATHDWAQDGFVDPPLLERAATAPPAVPAVFVHGRADVSSRSVTAWRLHRAWPGGELVVVQGAGHGGAAMRTASTSAVNQLTRAQAE